jgi:signal transduction histidine kinase
MKASHDQIVNKQAAKPGQDDRAPQALTGDLERHLLRALMDGTDDAILVTASDGRILALNERFRALLPGTETGKMLPTCLAEAGHRRLLAGLSEATIGSPVRLRLARPIEATVEIRSAPVGRGHVYVVREVADETEVDRLKDEFLSVVSHELRTPLTAIRGFVDLILDGDAGAINPEQKEYLTIVQQNSSRLLALINDLLDVSSIELGRLKLEWAPVPVADVVAEAVSALESQIQRKGQTLTLRLDPEVPPILGDRRRLVQVMLNLLSNAHAYTPAGGAIEIGARLEDNCVEIEVEDNGIGIAPKDQEKLFQRFFRVDSSLTREAGGTGLGLALVKAIVELLGGAVSATSELGKGSLFRVALPAATQEARE